MKAAKFPAGLLAAALAYYALARFGMAIFALKPSNITLLWLPSGIALAMCLEWGYRAVPYIVLASLAANFDGMAAASSPAHLAHTAVAALTDGLAGALAMHMYRSRLPDGLVRPADLLPFIFYVCLAPTALSSLILAANLASGGYIGWPEAGGLARVLVLADSLGLLLVYPAYQAWRQRSAAPPLRARPLLAAGVAVLALLLAGQSGMPGMEYFIIPVLLMLSFHSSLLGLTAVSALAIVAVMAAAAHHAGPFAGTGGDVAFRVAAFAFSSALTVLGAALQHGQLEHAERTRRQWQEAAEHDALTGLPNRRLFMPKVQMEHQRSLRSGKPYAIAMLDLDHFKAINDCHGHAAGDLVLDAVATVLRENCRMIDTPARVGGEEFAVLLPECSGAQARPFLERLRGKLEELEIPVAGQRVRVTVSIGIASVNGPYDTANAVAARADQALYRAKQAGRNCSIVDAVAA
jgi:diguanylate cyclase (GGDEF)-like protein